MSAGEERYYADIAAVRIQDWLGRSPGLMFRRGASALLSKATDFDQWQGRLPDGVRWNAEAGNVDGVIPLVADASAADPRAALSGAARVVARRMRDLMPYCPLQAVAGSGPSYAEAYAGITGARAAGDYLLDWPAPPPEVILAKPCDQCLQAAATGPKVTIFKDEKPLDLCEECRARASFEFAGRTTARGESYEPAPERHLREALAKTGMTVTGFSSTFAETAEAGRRGRDQTASQIAVIYADGNRVGAFLRAAATAENGPPKSEIASVIDQAAIGALAAAVRACFPGQAEPKVLPHLAGGDDLLISVPAPDAWSFTVVLLDAFGSQLRDKTKGWADDPPTLSAGLVFHHKTYPFSDVVRLAGDLLRAAKEATSGRAASVAFLDVTADGGQPPEGREALTLKYLHDNADRFERTRKLPLSRRAALLDMARREDWDGFAVRLTDLPGNEPLQEFAADPGKPARTTVREALAQSAGRRHEVRRALDVARHWEGR